MKGFRKVKKTAVSSKCLTSSPSLMENKLGLSWGSVQAGISKETRLGSLVIGLVNIYFEVLILSEVVFLF